MTSNELDWLRLCDEHGRVVSAYGRAQRRASQVIAAQARRIEALETQVMQLRAAAIVHRTALVWAREDMEALQAAVPGLPKRLALAGQVRLLETRVRALVRAQTARPDVAGRAPAAQPESAPGTASQPGPDAGPKRGSNTAQRSGPRLSRFPAGAEKVVLWVSRDAVQQALTQRVAARAGMRLVQTSGDDAALLDHTLADADLVICQAGCVSHGDWWRMKDYCARKGKPCVLVDRPDALRRVIAARTPVAAEMDVEADMDTYHQDD